MTSHQQIWVDVTTLVHWRRPAVGIIRVEQQLSLWLTQNAQENILFCRYDRHTGQFYQIEAQVVKEHLQRISAYAMAQAHQAPLGASRLRQKLKRKVLAGINRLPASIGLPLINTLRSAKPRIIRTLNAARRLGARFKPGRRAVPPPQLGTPVDLPAGSTYVSLGLDWDYKDMAKLYQLKQEKGLKYLFFCYDIIPIRLPQLCVADVSRQFAHYFADLAWAADLILCISESSRHDLKNILDRLGVPCPRTEVIHLGGDILPGGTLAAPPSGPVAEIIKHPYILFVSTIERRKNHEILYRAYTRLAEKGIELPKLIFVGMPGWGVQELMTDMALDPRTQGLIHQLNHISDDELAILYQHASFTVYPSLYEGWGLPVAESLAFGKFCLSSNTSSLPEVGGDWVEYLDPWDLPAWVERLEYHITHPEQIAERNARIAAGYRPHPWSQTARDIYNYAGQLEQTRQ